MIDNANIKIITDTKKVAKREGIEPLTNIIRPTIPNSIINNKLKIINFHPLFSKAKIV